ncbi:tail fiber protein [Viridibacillus sp. FSL H8-0110]|uniref:tail fiber protein n=1 Tax=Viridibacillus sp. FSL H8-0110 TaxID=2921376 RepID=UPI0030F751DD
MAEKFSFFDPVEDESGVFDREYNAQEFTDYFASLVTTGVMKGAGNQLNVSADGSSMITKLNTGVAFVEGRYYANDSLLNHTHDTETVGKSRIDRFVIRLDLSTEARHVKSFVKKGVASVSPVEPTLTQTANIYEISVAQVRIVGGQTFISTFNVTDERGKDTICPWAGSKILPSFNDNLLAQHIEQKASKSEFGHVKIGNGITVNNGVINADIPVIQDATTSQKGVVKLNNSYSTDTSTATTPYAVKLAKEAVDNGLSVKLGYSSYTANDNCVAVGNSASVSAGFASVAVGFRATTSANSATAIGPDAKVMGYEGIAIGNGSTAKGSDSVAIAGNANNNWQIMLGGSPSHSVRTEGSWSVGGSKNFEIPHTHPDKQHTHILRHGTVESPTAGDNLYRYEIEATENGQTVEFQLPDYFKYLNKDVDVWVNPHLHFGRAYGVVVSDKLKVTCETKGKYKALVIGTRNDNHDSIQSWHIRGVERQIGESWYGETQLIEIEELIDIKEISNTEEY